MKYLKALTVWLAGLAMMMAMCALTIGAGWYGFDLRGGAMFTWCCASAVLASIPMIGFDMIAQDIVEGR